VADRSAQTAALRGAGVLDTLSARTAPAPELDELDLRIIAQLQDDGRKPSTEIARALRVPRTTIARRIERLVRDGIITIGVFANGPRIGLPVHAMIELQVAPNKYEAVVAEVVALDEVRWVGILSGPFDLLIEGMFRRNEDLRHFLLEKLARIDGITRMQTCQVLEVAKIAFDWERMRHAGDTSVQSVDSGEIARPATPADGHVEPRKRREIKRAQAVDSKKRIHQR
jgi:Lrp/AsnC family transcriptional regulator, regulator for asnA, asnC and gidA